MEVDMAFEPAEPQVFVGDWTTDGSCNVYGCGTTHSAKVWVIDLGGLVVRLCRRHARDVRTQLPSR